MDLQTTTRFSTIAGTFPSQGAPEPSGGQLTVMKTAKGQGMTLLNEALFKYVGDKQVAPEEAYIKATDKQGFVTMLKSKGITLTWPA